MAVGEVRRPGVTRFDNGSFKSDWIVAHDDARTAQSASDLLRPDAIDDAVFHWVRVPDGAVRVAVRTRTPAATTAVTTSPLVRLIGLWGAVNDDGSLHPDSDVARLDSMDANAGGPAVTIETGAGVINTAGFDYSNPAPSWEGWDCRGASYVGLAVETAAAITPDAAVELQAMFTN